MSITVECGAHFCCLILNFYQHIDRLVSVFLLSTFKNVFCSTFFSLNRFCNLRNFVGLPQRDNLYGRGTQQTLTQSREFPPPLTVPPLHSPSLSPHPLYPALHLVVVIRFGFLLLTCNLLGDLLLTIVIFCEFDMFTILMINPQA